MLLEPRWNPSQAGSPPDMHTTQRAALLTLRQREGRPSARPPGAAPTGVHSLLERRRRECSEEGKDERREGDGDFRDFPEVGLLGPAAELGERSPREVAHKPSAINHIARGGVSHQGGKPAGKD